MELIELAAAHLQTVRTRIDELTNQQAQISSEIQRLNEILAEGTKLVESHLQPSDNSTVN